MKTDYNMSSKFGKEWHVVFNTSKWSIHRFEIWSGDLIATVEALRMKDSLLLWIGDGTVPRLEELALGVPSTEHYTNELATELLSATDGTHSRSKNLAARLAKSLNKNVYVSCNLNLDRFSWPLVEKGLIMEMKNRPNCF